MEMTYYRRTEADGTTTWVALPTKAGHWHTPPPGWVMEERCPVDVARVVLDHERYALPDSARASASGELVK